MEKTKKSKKNKTKKERKKQKQSVIDTKNMYRKYKNTFFLISLEGYFFRVHWGWGQAFTGRKRPSWLNKGGFGVGVGVVVVVGIGANYINFCQFLFPRV